jgi:uncharacterized protein
MTDDLDAPLGRQPPRSTKFSRLWLALAALVALATFSWRLAKAPGAGGEPVAVARIEPEPEPAPAPAASPAQVVEPAPPATADDGDGERYAGVKITRRGEGGGAARIIHVEPAFGVRLPPAPDIRVVEKGRDGLLPKVAADGARPMDVYARPFAGRSTICTG